MRTCPECGETKPLDGFNAEKRGREGRSARCKECRNRQLRQRWKDDPEYRIRKRAASKAWADAHPWPGGRYARYRDATLKRNYGITHEDYEQRLADQGGGCAICGDPPPDNRCYPVDHDHNCCPKEQTCGKCLRGILCVKCNVGLGNYRDRPDLLIKAAEYLREYA